MQEKLFCASVLACCSVCVCVCEEILLCVFVYCYVFCVNFFRYFLWMFCFILWVIVVSSLSLPLSLSLVTTFANLLMAILCLLLWWLLLLLLFVVVLLVDWPTGNDCLEAASFRFWPLLYFTSSIVRPVCVDAGRVQEQEMVSEMAREIVLRVYEKVLCISEIVCLLVCVCVSV